MGLVKRLGRNDRIRGLLCWIAAQYIRLVWATGRRTEIGRDIPAGLGTPMIITLWHSRLLMGTMTWIGGPLSMLTSHHKDGRLIARTVAHLGIGAVDGSTSRGGAAAFRALLRELKAGRSVGITPDGPRGPRQRATAGIIETARLSGVPIMPLTVSWQGRLMDSWDRFLVPYPFAKGVILWGEPILVPRDADVEAARLRLENALNALTAKADALTGMPTPEPEDPA